MIEDIIQVKVIETNNNWVLCEYEYEGLINRKWVPRKYLDTSIKGNYPLRMDYLNMGMEYAGVDLTDIFSEKIEINIAFMQDEFRRNGIWSKEDYQLNHDVISNVFRKMINLEINKIINAVSRY